MHTQVYSTQCLVDVEIRRCHPLDCYPEIDIDDQDISHSASSGSLEISKQGCTWASDLADEPQPEDTNSKF